MVPVLRMCRSMRELTKRLAVLAGFGLAMLLGACQGNLGSGSGLALPAAPQNGPSGSSGASSQSREQSLDGAVYRSADMAEIPLPSVQGYGVTLTLGTPGPSPSPTDTAAIPSSTPPGGKSLHRSGARGRTHGGPMVPTPAPRSTAPSPSPTPTPAPSASASASASAGARNNVTATATASPAPTASGAKTVTKTTVFPGDSPAAPTPQPSGNVQTFLERKAIVRGYVQPGSDIALYGLGAVRFTIPTQERVAGRGYTVAAFANGRKHRHTLLAYDARAQLANNLVASDKTDPLVLKKGTGYLLVLYGDDLPATPPPVPAEYSSPGINPFVTPQPGVSGGFGSPLPGASTSPPSQLPR